MIPSFHLLHEPLMRKLRPQKAVSIGPETGLEKWTIEDLIANGRGRRFVDNPWVDYSELVAPEGRAPFTSPFTKYGSRIAWPERKPGVAVVGAGMSGLLTAYQLLNAGFQVYLYEAGDTPGELGAGRIKPTLVHTPDPSGESSAELGAMRFPSTSFLFWHYLKLFGVASPGDTFMEFPNVAKVPSLFTGDSSLSGVWANGKLSLPEEYDDLNQRHMEAFNDWTAPGTNLKTRDIRELLHNPDQAAQDKINLYWGKARETLYQITYEEFLKQQGFSDDEIRKIGYMGLGTGGFAPLFPVSAQDIFRLILWGYSGEFAVPDLKRFPEKMLETMRKKYPNQFLTRYKYTVKKLGYSASARTYYVKAFDQAQNTSFVDEFSFVVLSMTHVAAQKLLSNGATESWETRVPHYIPDDTVCPFYDVGLPASMPSNIRRELENQQGMSAVKVFQTIAGPGLAGSDDSIMPLVSVSPAEPVTYDCRIRTSYGNYRHDAPGAVGMGVTYLLPLRKYKGETPVPFAQQTYVNSLQYSWGAESQTFCEQVLFPDPDAGSPLRAAGLFQGREVDPSSISGKIGRNMNNRILGARTGPEIIGNPLKGFVNYFQPDRGSPPQPDEGYLSIVVWHLVPYIWTGFKLDSPGIGSYLVSAYATVTSQNKTMDSSVWDTYDPDGKSRVHPAVKNLFFAGDSFSHYGGWVEGAFQSALAASAAVIRQATVNAYPSSWQDYVNVPAIEALVDKTPVPS